MSENLFNEGTTPCRNKPRIVLTVGHIVLEIVQNLMTQTFDALRLIESACVWIEEYQCFNACQFGVVNVNVLHAAHQFVNDSSANS